VAAPVVQAVGVFDAGTTSFTADVPAARQANDILVLVVESSNGNDAGTPNTPTGFTRRFERTQNAGVSTCTTLSVFAKVSDGTEGDFTCDGFTNHGAGTVLVIRGAKASLAAADLLVGSGNGAGSGNGTMLGLTTEQADSLVLMVCGTTRDAAADDTTFSAWTNANLTGITEHEDQTTAQAAGGGFGVASGVKASAGATGDSTVTIAVSQAWNSVHLAFEPLAAGTATLGLVSETNTAQALGRLSTTAISAPTETNLAQQLVGLSAKAIALASETNTAQALGRAKAQALVRVTEVDSALALGRAKTAVLGRATETNVARAITALITVVIKGHVRAGARRVLAVARARRVRAEAPARRA
jgi:hypothetical protein